MVSLSHLKHGEKGMILAKMSTVAPKVFDERICAVNFNCGPEGREI